MYLIYKSTRIEELETFDSKGSLSQKSLTKSFKRKRTVDIDTDVLKMELKYMRDVLKALESKKLDEYLPKIEEQNDFFTPTAQQCKEAERTTVHIVDGVLGTMPQFIDMLSNLYFV